MAFSQSPALLYSLCVSLADNGSCAEVSQRETGLNLAVRTMRRGEKCRLFVTAPYGYGDRGSPLLLEHVCNVFLNWGYAERACFCCSLFPSFCRLTRCQRPGSFSFPTVPPGADLEYELELIEFSEVDEVGSLSPPLFVNNLASGVPT